MSNLYESFMDLMLTIKKWKNFALKRMIVNSFQPSVAFNIETSQIKWMVSIWNIVKIVKMKISFFFTQCILRKFCKNTSFHWPIFFRIKTESTILSLYGRIRVSENPYSPIFYTVTVARKELSIFWKCQYGK